MIERHFIRPPDYGTAEWHALDDSDPRKQAALVHAAECWRILASSPHLEVVLGEWSQWLACKEFRDSAAAISVLQKRWDKLPTFAELQRRRVYTGPDLTPAQIRAQARASWAEYDQTRGTAA